MAGSLINRLTESSKQPEPRLGDGATILMYTDRKAGTIIEISKSGRVITVQRDHAIRTDKNGMSDSQNYRYERDPEGSLYKFSLRKDGSWKEVKGTSGLWIGGRNEYHDFSF